MVKNKIIILSILLCFLSSISCSLAQKPESFREEMTALQEKRKRSATLKRALREAEIEKTSKQKEGNLQQAKEEESDKKAITEEIRNEKPVKSLDNPVKIQDEESRIVEDEDIILNVEDVTIFEFAELIFSEILKRNYVMSPALKESPIKLTVRMSKPVLRSKILNLASKILKQHDILIQEKEGMYNLIPTSELGSMALEFRRGKTPPPISDELGLIFQVIPLDYIGSGQLDYIARRYLSSVGQYLSEGSTNSIIIIDYPERVAKILEILNILDKEIFEDVVLHIVKLTFWEASVLVKQVQELLGAESIPVLTPRGRSRGVLLIPIDRLGEIYIFASNEEWLERALFFIERLDNPEALGGEERTFIYFPINSSAVELGSVMNEIMSISKETGARPQSQQTETPQTQLSNRLIIDENKNALIFITSPSNWTVIKGLLKKLDIPVKQVMIEAIIGELTIDEQFKVGVELFLQNNNIKFDKKIFTGQGGTEGGIGLGGLGFLYTLVSNNNLFRAAINAFVTENMIEIISAPKIIGTDNKPAMISVGTDVPVVTSEAITGQIQQQGTTGLLRSIQYRTTGVILTITPTIHSAGVVSLEINQEISEAQTNTISPGIQSPLILRRSISTTLVAKNGQTIFIGGLISKNISTTITGIPLLSKLPLIGGLFRTKSTSERKSEFIILLTPYIMAGPSDLDFISEEFRKRIMPDIENFSFKKKKSEVKKNEKK